MKKRKQYPMDGPPLHIQKLMKNPRKNRDELRAWAASNKSMRPETLAICYLK